MSGSGVRGPGSGVPVGIVGDGVEDRGEVGDLRPHQTPDPGPRNSDGGRPGRCLILGCGVVGALVGNRLVDRGWTVVGSRRRPWARESGDPCPAFPVLAGSVLPVGPADAILVAANPGIRRGRDNGVAALVTAARHRWPTTRLVLVSTTSLYGDAEGAGVTEDGPLGQDPESQALRAIERAVEGHVDALVLRATALVGPTRTFARTRARAARLAGTPLTIKGDPDRPFSYLHDDDLADLAADALGGDLGTGILNAACPHRLTVRAYYQQAAEGPLDVLGDGTDQPRRWIDAGRLWAQRPAYPWRVLDGPTREG